MSEAQTLTPAPALPIRTAVQPSLGELAIRIRADHEAVIEAIKNAVPRAIAAGEALNLAKSRMEHSEWLPWLRDNCALNERTAQRYMKLAAGKPKLDKMLADKSDAVKSDTLSDLTLSGAERLLRSDEKEENDDDARKPKPKKSAVDTLVQSVDRTLAKLAKDDSDAAQAAATRIIAQASRYLAQAKAKDA